MSEKKTKLQRKAQRAVVNDTVKALVENGQIAAMRKLQNENDEALGKLAIAESRIEFLEKDRDRVRAKMREIKYLAIIPLVGLMISIAAHVAGTLK